jgi:signal transduction histidine kinase
MNNDLMSMTTHELRSPLTSIKGSLDTIASESGLPDIVKSMVDIARTNCDRLLRLINDILDVQRLESGRPEFQCTDLQLAIVLQKAIDANGGLAVKAEVVLRTPGTIPDVVVVADEDRFIQVMTNLLSNAVKYSPKAAVVEVFARVEDGVVRIEVKDYGPGIPPEFQAQVFEKFARDTSLAVQSKQSTGLGLSVAKMIVERHNGQIGFTTSDQGTVFWFTIPQKGQS